ncbi:putative WAP domain-containing protein [Seiridium unicorne]|uniref:WAP domain-containing protein n=1 Tax=Seiridium unicorne TaxID=138068 RepID=A0ABR2UVC1_9PEZI
MKTSFVAVCLAMAASTVVATRDISSIMADLPRDPTGHGRAVFTPNGTLQTVDGNGTVLGEVTLPSNVTQSLQSKRENRPAPVSRVKRNVLEARDCSHYPCDEDDDCKAYDCHWGCMGDDTFGVGFCI